MSELGELTNADAKRDAVHVAIAPVRCGTTAGLMPGARVKVAGQWAYGVIDGISIGIVDPFLESPVQYGKWFYVIMLPGTITGLRHDWSHPDFPDEDEDYDDDCRGC